MKALILQHENTTPPGSSLLWLKNHNIEYRIHFFSQGDVGFDEKFDILFICGGSVNVDQENEYPWLITEKAFIKGAILRGVKIVGLCLGAQLLSEALGGKVEKASQWEVGWQTVKILGSHTEMKVFQWHGYQFTTPPGAVKTAESAICPNQAYTVGNNIIAFQFHPESTEAWVSECAVDPDLPAKDTYVQDKNEIMAGMENQKPMQDWYFSKLDSILL